MEQPDVYDVIELAEFSPGEGAFLYPTGSVWPVAEVLTLLAEGGKPGGVKAGLELCYLGARILHEASEAMPIRPPAGHSVPPGLMDLLLRCMAPDPIDRPLSMEQVAEALDLARHGTWMEPRVALTAGEAILREGEGGTAAYVVESGELEVVQEHSGHVRTLGPGDVFGELAALTGGIRSSSVIARTDCVLACIEGEKLVQALDMGNLGGRFVQALAQRLLDNERRDRGGSSDA